MNAYTLSKEQIDQIVSLADEFDASNEDCYDAAAELVIKLAKEIKSERERKLNNDIELPS